MKFKKTFALFTLLLLVGCGQPDVSGTVKSGEVSFSEICIDGVIYLYKKAGHRGFMAVKFNRDSKVVTCERGNH